MSILEQSHGLRNSIHLYSFMSSLVYIYIYIYTKILELATVYIHEQVTDQIFCHEAFTFSIVIIYIYIYTYIRMAVANKVLYCGYIYIYIY